MLTQGTKLGVAITGSKLTSKPLLPSYDDSELLLKMDQGLSTIPQHTSTSRGTYQVHIISITCITIQNMKQFYLPFFCNCNE